MIKKIIRWFALSNRYKHFFGGFLIGANANTVYCALYAGAGVASALELKDKLHGGKWDWIDWAVTLLGVIFGSALRQGITYEVMKKVLWM